MKERDPLAIGLGSLGSGVGFGGGAIIMAQIALSIMRFLAASTYERVVPSLLVGVFMGMGVAAVVGWRNSRALDNIWQNGVIGVLSAVGALLVGFLAAPVDHYFGLLGLVAWFALTVGLGVAGRRWALRGRGEEAVAP